MRPYSSGSRSASSALRGNSGSSSRNSTPRCARLTSPGLTLRPPPVSAAIDALWCGERFDLFGGLTIGRSSEADVRIEDRFASSIHARVYSRGPNYYVEDMNSTNGTFLNGAQLDGEARLGDLDEVRIGETEFRFELEVPGAE